MFFKSARAPIRGTVLPKALQEQANKGLIKSAAMQSIILQPDHWYLDVWAVSSYEKFGLNENADGFEHEELQRAHPTFIGSWACLDHENHREDLSVGRNVDAVYTPDQYVRIAMGINRKKGEARHPGLEAKVATGQITDTSMGCLARESVCTIPKCANVATNEKEYCIHVTEHRGQKLCNSETNWLPVVCGELNRGVIFFEDSIITAAEGADNNAKILAKLASHGAVAVGNSIPADALYKAFMSLSRTASTEEKALITGVVEQLIRQL